MCAPRGESWPSPAFAHLPAVRAAVHAELEARAARVQAVADRHVRTGRLRASPAHYPCADNPRVFGGWPAMPLIDEAAIIPGTGFIFLADPDTPKPVNITAPLNPGPGWSNLGHTSRDEMPEFARDGDAPGNDRKPAERQAARPPQRSRTR
ncbi:DUF5403 family protein [Streptomyces sp. NPDC048483]|uniref:phage tail tube protein n=1 Tax=Streptomyces sp. NPDC048483 TaxID=3154927 RepID=UPI0034447590